MRSDALLYSAASWLVILTLPLMLLGPAALEIAVALTGIMFIAHSILTRDGAWVRESWVQLLLLLWVFITVRSLFTDDPVGAFTRSALWIRYIIYVAALRFWILTSPLTQKRLWNSLLITGAFLVADTFLQYVRGVDLFGHSIMISESVVRLTGPFTKPRVGITLTWMMLPALTLLLAAGIRHARGWAGVILTMASVTAVFLSGERMGFLLLMMGVGLTFLLVKKARGLLLIAGCGGALLMIALATQNPALKERQVGQSSRTIAGFWHSTYGQLWFSSLQMASVHPLFGVGAKQFRTECIKPAYGAVTDESLNLRCKLHPHNIYMEWLAEAGFIGFGLFIAVLTHWLYVCWQQRRHIITDPLLAGLFITLMIRLWPLSATTSQFAGWSAAIFWLLVGWLLARLHTLSSPKE
jgi:O-antigen ligase